MFKINCKMNIKEIALTLIFTLTLSNGFCQENQNNSTLTKSKKLSNKELKSWYHKDFEKDTIPGISLDKLYNSGLLSKTKGKEVIVAVIDTKLDIDHEDLKGYIWINKGEIANNNIDDDKNGYIDDKNGWDFLSNTKGQYIKYQSSEIVRIIKKYQHKFETKNSTDLDENASKEHRLYLEAKKQLESKIERYKTTLGNFDKWITKYDSANNSLKGLLKKENISIQDLNNLLKTAKDSVTITHAKFLKNAKETDLINTLTHYKKWYGGMLNTTLNLNYNEREVIGDNPNDINDKFYGNPNVSGEVPFNHSISVSGVIGANRNNNIGAKGFSTNIKIMPVVMVASGDEHDKDIALAIRYAVDNGARVINMSWGKRFSLHQDWVLDAIKYAESKNVLIVHGAGNDAINTDVNEYYPKDHQGDLELVNNFIAVGASGYNLSKNLLTDFSSYGKKTVDVFAPGVKIYTTEIDDKYQFSRGTSLAAPMVSGLAGLLWSYYPELSASEIKEIIMKSGTSYDTLVTISDTNNQKKQIPFSELSKSGKIINAYNAFIMASKLKKDTK
ncbi:Subtilase family protein [Tenacibaculum sp. 190130A14a]|uniref:Cell wall-associated protease n=2 Tax=Tenacibaculum polynesiense TaxID=3137857 RepID=A0ABP1F2Q5_9FLAO